jgi:hypothetical protein
VTKVQELIAKLINEERVHDEGALELAERVLSLTNIVNPPADKFEECWCALFDQVCMFDFREADSREAPPPSQQTKDAARRIADALERAQNAARNLDFTMKHLRWSRHCILPASSEC